MTLLPNWTTFRQSFSLAGAPIDPDGIEQWPLNMVRLTGSGFGDTGTTVTGIPAPYAGVAFNVTCNAQANDAVSGVAEFDWYCSQRSDTAATQYLSMVQFNPGGGNTASGTVTIGHTALATSELGSFVPPVDPVRMADLFRHTYLYVQRRSDNAIQWVDVLRRMTASYID